MDRSREPLLVASSVFGAGTLLQALEEHLRLTEARLVDLFFSIDRYAPRPIDELGP